MFDMSWGEVLVIGAVALIVIGPKELPKALRTLGQMTTKMRRMASEFQSQFNEAMREAELDDVKKQVQGINDSVGSLTTGFNPIQTLRDELKSSIEAPVTPPVPTPAGTVPEMPAGPQPSEALPAPAEPQIALPLPPGVADPARSVADAVESTAADIAKEPSPEGVKT